HGEHLAELDVMRRWWRSWYGGELPPPTAEDSAWMSGMPAGEDVDRLSREHGAAFEQRFLALMLPHHEGAVAMAVQARGEGGDPRIRLFGDAVAHAQRGQIAFMRRYVK
ncbi:MAG TPA: DUF305 domain-containing protein, partial [Solirubrobacteraceae bacterium]|nr:DUF305 domain-containing protein [Solirubrobacteraceae bacterium]